MMRRWGIASAILAALGALRSPVILPGAMAAQQRPGRSRLGRGNYGKNLRAHFDRVGVNWSNKKRSKRK